MHPIKMKKNPIVIERTVKTTFPIVLPFATAQRVGRLRCQPAAGSNTRKVAVRWRAGDSIAQLHACVQQIAERLSLPAINALSSGVALGDMVAALLGAKTV